MAMKLRRHLLLLVLASTVIGGGFVWRQHSSAARRLAAWNDQQQDERVFAALDNPVDLTCEELMLDKFAERLAAKTGLEFVIEADALKLAGVGPPEKTPVEVFWPNLPAASHLALAHK